MSGRESLIGHPGGRGPAAIIAAALLLILAFSFTTGSAIELDPAKERPLRMQEGEKGYKVNILTLPILAYTPEATFMLGFNFMLVWDKDERELEEETSVVNILFLYTLLNQVICAMSTVNYIPGIMMVKSGVFYQKFPSRFFGIGPNTSGVSEKYTPQDLKYRISGLFNPFPDAYIGPRYEFCYFEIAEADNPELFNEASPFINEETYGSGFGMEAVWDSRDNFFYPYSGSQVQLIVIGYHKYFGSAGNFWRLEFDSRFFFRIIGKHVFALQYYMIMTGGDVPFQLMGKLGGMNTMRGYYEGRYIDQNYYTLQGEYRFPLFWRLSGVLFCGIGLVSPRVREIDFDYLRVSWGGGLRLAVQQERMINLRLDVAVNDVRFGEDDYGVYFSVTEAF